MVKPNGLVRIVRYVLAPRALPGLVRSSMRMICILGLNVPTKDCVIVVRVCVNVLKDTMDWPVNVTFAPRIAIIVVLVSHNVFLRIKLDVSMIHLGMR